MFRCDNDGSKGISRDGVEQRSKNQPSAISLTIQHCANRSYDALSCGKPSLGDGVLDWSSFEQSCDKDTHMIRLVKKLTVERRAKAREAAMARVGRQYVCTCTYGRV